MPARLGFRDAVLMNGVLAGMPLWAFFGGSGTALTTDITITTGSPEREEEEREMLRRILAGEPVGRVADALKARAIPFEAIARGNQI